MLAHSQGFKNSINGFGRELDVKITYYGNNGYLATQDNKLVLTEDNMKILMEENQSGKVRLQIDSDDLYKVDKNNLGELFRTYMKSFDIETTTDLEIGSIVNVEIGCKVDDEYEYLNYGHYIVYTKNYNEDTKTYEYQLCDYMLKTMIPFKWDDIVTSGGQVFEQTTLSWLERYICDYCGLPRPDTTNMPNGDEIVYKKTFEGYNLTCRDVLDMLLQASGVSLRMNDETPTLIDWHTQVVDTINEDNLKNKNVKFVNKFGPINSLVFSRGDGTDNLAKKDQESIDDYGETQYFIQNNLILDQDNREDFLFELFYQIKGLEYYECDIDLIGLEYIEYMDRFNVQIGDNTYNCLCLKNTSSIKNGLTENLKSEEPKEKKQEYIKEALSDKDASIVVDKIKGTIVLKTDSDGKLAKVRLDSSGDDGSLVEISGDQIDLTGKNINLTSDDITITSEHFSVTKEGNMTCSNANITGGKIDLNTDNYDNYILVHSNNNKNEWNIGSTNITGRNNGIQKIIMSSSTGNASFNEVGANKLTIGLNGEIECYGSIWCQGNLQVDGSKNRVVDIGDKKILMNAYETATPYFGDIGSDKTDKNGICKIKIDETFAQTISKDDYKVFIQECGEGKLWVEKHDNYFYVKGTPDLEFDWEIKAIQKGYENTRLEELKEEIQKLKEDK